MHPSLLILLVGLIYLFGFGALSFLRRQGLSTRFAIEGLIVTGIGAGLAYASVPFHPLLFLVLLYLVTMRVRLLVDLGNWFTSIGWGNRALALFRLALRLGPDTVSRQIVLINRGVTQLCIKDPEAAYLTLKEALFGVEEGSRVGAKYLAAGYYNWGLACSRTGRKAESARRFNEAIDAWPRSIYGEAARKELEKRQSKGDPRSESGK